MRTNGLVQGLRSWVIRQVCWAIARPLLAFARTVVGAPVERSPDRQLTTSGRRSSFVELVRNPELTRTQGCPVLDFELKVPPQRKELLCSSAIRG